MTRSRSNSIWGQGELESSLPHIIVDENGKQMLPRYYEEDGKTLASFKNRGQATRILNQLKRQHNPTLLGNPKLWTVQPVRKA